jgi:hypothetical protein
VKKIRKPPALSSQLSGMTALQPESAAARRAAEKRSGSWRRGRRAAAAGREGAQYVQWRNVAASWLVARRLKCSISSHGLGVVWEAGNLSGYIPFSEVTLF